MKFSIADSTVASTKAITKEIDVRPVKSSMNSFTITFTTSVDKYNKLNIINLADPAVELLNVKVLLTKQAKIVPIEKLTPFDIYVINPI